MTTPIANRLLPPRAVLTGTGNGQSLENENPTGLADGTLAWVIGEASLYYLSKSSVAAVAPPQVIATCFGDGVPGRWLLYASGQVGATGATGPTGATGATGAMGLGVTVNGDIYEIGTGETMVQAAVLGGRRVVSLALGANITSGQMPTNSGDRVGFMAEAAIVPSANPVGGVIEYVSAGVFHTRQPNGVIT